MKTSPSRKNRSEIGRIGQVQSNQSFDIRSEHASVSLSEGALKVRSKIM